MGEIVVYLSLNARDKISSQNKRPIFRILLFKVGISAQYTLPVLVSLFVLVPD